MKKLPLGMIGRSLFSLPLIGFGLGHLMNANGMTGLVLSYFPVPLLFVYLMGIALLAAASSIII